jgi:hypothetical protein
VATPTDPYAIELALAAALAKVTDRHEATITQAWVRAWSEVSRDLLDALAEVLDAGGRVNAMAVVRYERLAAVLGAIADQLESLTEQLGITITSDLRDVLAMADQGTAQLIAAQLLDRPIDVLPAPPHALTAIVRRTTEQVTSQLQPLADDTYAIILRELTRGVAAGDNPRETAARMVQRAEDLHNFGMNRALTIARTEVLDAHREAARVAQDANADVLAGWMWLAHLGPRTCRSCLAMHGQVFGLEVRGPDDHQQGRCSRCPVVREEDGSVDTSWVPSAEDHFMQLPREDQVAILGPKGYRAWAAGDYPMEAWTKTRSSDGWRDAQVPAPPGDPDSGSGRDDGTLPPAPGSGSDEHSYRSAALDRLGEPPEESDRTAVLDYWRRRQGLLPVDFHGELPKPHEVEFVERFLDAGEDLEWIPNVRSTATSDFIWNGDAFELKSTKARFETIHGAIVKSSSRAMKNHGVVKNRFMIDLGDVELTDDLREALAEFNVGRRRYRLASLWVMSRGRLEEIALRT